MKSAPFYLKRILLAACIALSLSCSLATQVINPATLTPLPSATASATDTPTPTPTRTATLTLTATQTLVPTEAVYIPPMCQGKPIATLPAGTLAAAPTISLGTNAPVDKATQLKVFTTLSDTIQKVYVYPDFNGLDWPAQVAKYKAKIDKGLDSEAFYTAMVQFVNDLGDDHSSFQSPVAVAASKAELAGSNKYVGIGAVVLPMLDKSRAAIILTFPDSSAEHSGLKQHDSLLAVDGLPVADSQHLYNQRLRGPACSAAVLTVQSPGQAPRQVTVMRAPISSSMPIIAQLVPTKDGSHIGYIFIPTFFDETVPKQVEMALQNFGDLDGLILDNRMNGGGSSDVVNPIFSFFAKGHLGDFVSRMDRRPFNVKPDPINNSQTVPLVILVGKDTVSFGEIFSGALQDSGRAKIVGQASRGNVEILYGYNFPDGSLAWIAHDRFEPERSHAGWEKTGVKPDVDAYADWDTFTFETDPGIAAALKLLGH